MRGNILTCPVLFYCFSRICEPKKALMFLLRQPKLVTHDKQYDGQLFTFCTHQNTSYSMKYCVRKRTITLNLIFVHSSNTCAIRLGFQTSPMAQGLVSSQRPQLRWWFLKYKLTDRQMEMLEIMKRDEQRMPSYQFNNVLSNSKSIFLQSCVSVSESGQKKSQQEGRQLTLTLILVSVAFLLLVSPVCLLLTFFTFVNKFASPERFANFSVLYVIFKTVSSNLNVWCCT